MYVIKNGKDNLLVSGLDIVFDVIGSSPAKQIKFMCPGFAVRVWNRTSEITRRSNWILHRKRSIPYDVCDMSYLK